MLKNFGSRLTLATLLVISIISCVKEENKIGDDLIDGQNTSTIFTDTIEVSTKIKIVDSVKSANLNYSILGAINDPKFGKTNTALYSQLFLEQNNINFGTNYTFDSIVLILPYLDYYGDTTSNQNFKVYEVSETIDTFKTYSNQSYQISDLISNDLSFIPHPVASNSGSEESFGELRIPLTEAFGQKILSKSGLPELENDDNFKEFIKGIAIIPDNNHSIGEGALFTFDYQKIKVQLFYQIGTIPDSINFVFTNSTQHLNAYNHEYSGSEASSSFGQLNTENIYIQGLAGLEVEVDFPNIDQLQAALGGESVAINKAVLQMNRSTDTVAMYSAPTLLLANEYRKPSDGSTDEYNYYQILDGNKVGGLYQSDENLYNFTITRYLNQRLKGLSSEKLYLRSYTYRALDRVILSGVSGTDENKKMKLNVVYTVNDDN